MVGLWRAENQPFPMAERGKGRFLSMCRKEIKSRALHQLR
jgi:hypothetical protein